jgi:peptidyl-Asp metalloendopeptidase
MDTLLAYCATPQPALAQTGPGAGIQVLTRTNEALTPSQQAIVDRFKMSPEASNVRVRKILGVVADLLTDNDAKIVMPISGGKDVTLERTRPTVRSEGGAITWRGEAEETSEHAVLMLWKDGRLSGFFGYRGRVFTIKSLGGDLHVVADIDTGKLPPAHAPTIGDNAPIPDRRDSFPGFTPPPAPPEPTIAPFFDAERLALEAKKITIDVMILYTKKADDNYIADLSDMLPLAIEEANETFRNSGLGNITLRLVHSQRIDYDETGGDHFDHLYRMVDGVGHFKGLRKLRNDKQADIVGLILDSPSGCGLATRVGADSEEAFFIVHHSCAAITTSIPHEIGHILGARHDRAVDSNDKPLAYAHGYVNGTKWRTMMGYNEACGGCPRIPFWSNPRIMYRGEPTGTPAADNARVILQEAERVSRFKMAIP